MGALYFHQEKYTQAIESLEKAIKLDKNIPTSWTNLALVYAAIGKFDQADSALKQAIVLGYKNPSEIRERIDELKSSHGK